jgi:hypothetical protein
MFEQQIYFDGSSKKKKNYSVGTHSSFAWPILYNGA